MQEMVRHLTRPSMQEEKGRLHMLHCTARLNSPITDQKKQAVTQQSGRSVDRKREKGCR